MPIYKLPCEDGTDRHCREFVEKDIPVFNLTKSQLEDIARDGGTFINATQIKKSSLKLTKEEETELKKNGKIYFKYDEDVICDPCGSDQSYDDEGNNITAE